MTLLRELERALCKLDPSRSSGSSLPIISSREEVQTFRASIAKFVMIPGHFRKTFTNNVSKFLVSRIWIVDTEEAWEESQKETFFQDN